MSYASNCLNTFTTHLPEYLPSSKCGKFCGVYNLNLAMMKIASIHKSESIIICGPKKLLCSKILSFKAYPTIKTSALMDPH